MNKIEKCTSAKKLCEGVIAMHEGTSKAKLARRDFLWMQLNTFEMQKGEKVTQCMLDSKRSYMGLLALEKKF